MLEDDNTNDRNLLLTNHQVFPESIEIFYIPIVFFFSYLPYLDGLTQDVENKKGPR